jgi:hypothetical protein
MGISPLVRIAELDAEPLDDGFFRIRARIENRGGLPTHVSEQALLSEATKPVIASIMMHNATLVGGDTSVDLGHIPARSSTESVEWLVRALDTEATVVIEAVSQKGGGDRRTVALN